MRRSHFIILSPAPAALISVLALLLVAMTGCSTPFSKDFPAHISSPGSTVRVNQTMQLMDESIITG